MSEKKQTKIEMTFDDTVIDSLKAQIRNGGSRPVSATMAIEIAIKSFQRDAGAVKLADTDRKEIESRIGASTPIRTSADIVRAFDKVQGGPDSVSMDIDPGMAELMRSHGRDMGYGLAEFCKIVLEESYMNQFVSTIELRPVYFTPAEFSKLLEITRQDRIASASALLSAVAEMAIKGKQECSVPAAAEVQPQ